MNHPQRTDVVSSFASRQTRALAVAHGRVGDNRRHATTGEGNGKARSAIRAKRRHPIAVQVVHVHRAEPTVRIYVCSRRKQAR